MATIGLIAVWVIGIILFILGCLYTYILVTIPNYGKDILYGIIIIIVCFALSFLCLYNGVQHISIKVV